MAQYILMDKSRNFVFIQFDKKVLTSEQRFSLLQCKDEWSKNWKKELLECWKLGEYPMWANSNALEQIKNEFGENWLKKYYQI